MNIKEVYEKLTKLEAKSIAENSKPAKPVNKSGITVGAPTYNEINRTMNMTWTIFGSESSFRESWSKAYNDMIYALVEKFIAKDMDKIQQYFEDHDMIEAISKTMATEFVRQIVVGRLLNDGKKSAPPQSASSFQGINGNPFWAQGLAGSGNSGAKTP